MAVVLSHMHRAERERESKLLYYLFYFLPILEKPKTKHRKYFIDTLTIQFTCLFGNLRMSTQKKQPYATLMQ